MINRKQGFYVMESTGVEYWFSRDFLKYPSTKGLHIVNGKTLPEFMVQLVAEELERLVTK